MEPTTTPTVETQNDAVANLRAIFIQESTIKQHHEAQEKNYSLYLCTLLNLLFQGVNVSKSSKPRILATCWNRKAYKLPELLLSRFEDQFGFPDLLRALKLLDCGRHIRCLEKKLANLEKQGTVKQRKIGNVKSAINDLQKEVIPGASVSGSLAKKIAQFLYQVDEEKLAFYALNMPKEPWKEMADILHLKPKSFKLDWFLPYMFGGEAPESSVIHACKSLTAETINDVLESVQVPYSYLRLQIKPLPEKAKAKVAEYAPLDTLIWYHEELACSAVNNIIKKRLEDGEKPKFGYGKLVERLLYFQSIKAPFYSLLMPMAEARLSKIKLALESPVAVFGDASSSMDVAIKTSTIIASVLTALCNARLTFFNNKLVDPPCIPKNIEQVLEVANKVTASGLTRPAACLWTYYKLRQVTKCIVLVSDEEENLPYYGHYFVTLLDMYRKHVYPCKVVFVSFLDNPSQKGPMAKELEEKEIPVIEFKLNGARPDLTKLDSLLGTLSCDGGNFVSMVKGLVPLYEKDGLDVLVQKFDNMEFESLEEKDTIKVAQRELLRNAEKALEEYEAEQVMLAKLESILGNKPVPDEFICPITRLLLRDPVLTQDGHTYERSAVENWLSNHDTSPLTGKYLDSKKLLPNHTLRKALDELCKRVDIKLEKLEIKKEEPKKKKEKPKKPTEKAKLDLVFCCDCTGSMGSYIRSAQNNIRDIAQSLAVSGNADVQFALVEYRDHPPQDRSFVTRVHPWTKSIVTMKSYVDKMSASGGGDGPEAVTAGLEAVGKFEYRPKSARICVLISDAPPHGCEPSGDGFPDGPPSKLDPLEVAASLAKKSITIYAVGVEPLLGSYKHARDYMAAIAILTNGQFLPLNNAQVLPQVIIGGAIEEISLHQMSDHAEAEIERIVSENPGIGEEELLALLTFSLQEQNVETEQLEVDNIYSEFDYANVDLMIEHGKFSKELKKAMNPGLNRNIKQGKSTGAKHTKKTVSKDQVKRLFGRAKKKSSK